MRNEKELALDMHIGTSNKMCKEHKQVLKEKYTFPYKLPKLTVQGSEK
jgi:hypothetical protein